MKNFGEITFRHILGEENQVAYALAKLSSMCKLNHPNEAPLIKMNLKDELAVCLTIREEFVDKLWFHDIKCFLKKKSIHQGHQIVTKKLCEDSVPKFSSTEMYSTKETTTWSF